MSDFINRLQEENWKDKYQHNNESLEDFFWRIANECSSVEKTPELRKEWGEKYFSILKDFKFTVGGRIAANIGTNKVGKTNFNCYINGPVTSAVIKYERQSANGIKIPCEIKTPETPDNLNNIFLTLLELAATLKSDGGYGANVSWIRPRGSTIKGIGVSHPGVIHYLSLWDAISNVIVQGDTDGYKDQLKNYLSDQEIEYFRLQKQNLKSPRKGAMLLCLNIDHPDIEEFIRAKRQSGRITKANLSVGITDDFMMAVENDQMWELKFDNIIYKRLKAKDLYDCIMESTWKYNDPGVLFLDNMNKNNPIIYLGKCDSTQACGEIPGNPLTSTICLLGSVNLTQFVISDRRFDWDDYHRTIKIAARLLDSVNDLENNPISQYNWAIKNVRQFGMGINGFGSTCAMLGIDYGNNKACLGFAERIARDKFYYCWDTSADLAKEKGVFPAYDAEKFLKTNFFQNMLSPFKGLQEKIIKYGVRNGKCTTNPPLGNSSILCGNVSNGIEPIFADKYERTYITSIWPDSFNKENIKQVLKSKKQGKDIVWMGEINGQRYVYEPQNRGLCKIELIEDYGVRYRRLNNISKTEPGYIMTKDLDVKDHLEVMRVFQRWTEQAISKTCNLPANYALDNLKNYYFDAWKAGLIGVTTYREGTMSSVLQTIEEKPSNIIKQDIKLPEIFINGPTHKIVAEGYRFYLHFSYLPEDLEKKLPIALWIQTNNRYKDTAICKQAIENLLQLAIDNGIRKNYIDDTIKKCDEDSFPNKIGRLISLNLRHNIALNQIIGVLENIKGDNINTLITAIRRFLSKHIDDGLPAINVRCDACKSNNMIFSSGCKTCADCGWGACG